MATSLAKVPKSLRKADPMKSKTGKLNLTALSLPALEKLVKTTKPKDMAKLNAEIAKRVPVSAVQE